MHVVDRTQDLEDDAVDFCLRKRFALGLRFQVAGGKQFEDEVDSLLIIEEAVERSSVEVVNKALYFDLSHQTFYLVLVHHVLLDDLYHADKA